MIRTSILLEDDRLTPLLDTLQQQFSPQGQAAILQEAGRRIGRIVVLRYPPTTGAPLPKQYRWQDGRMSKFKSPAHQRAFFGLLKSGKIRIPYRRTGNLARSLDFTVMSSNGAVDVRVSIPDNSPAGKYARYVVGTDLQRSTYFKERTNWRVLTFMIEDQQEEITQAVAVTFETVFKELGL